MKSNILKGLQTALKDYQASLTFLENNNSTSLLVSYDKVMQNPLLFIESLAQFCGLMPSTEQQEKALNFISRNPLNYLEQSRITRAQGRLAGLYKGQLAGWARYFYKPMERKTKVNIFLNDKFLVSTQANKPRKDLQDKFGHPCAFFQDIPDDIILQPGDVIRARVDQEVQDLENSPLRLKLSDFSENEGRLGGVSEGKVFGWAKMKYTTPSKPLIVDIYLNDQLILMTKADQKRKDLQIKFGIDCGFNETLPDDIRIKAGDIIRAKVRNDICELENSPLVK